MSRDDAVKAAAEAVHASGCDYEGPYDECAADHWTEASLAVDAAAPHLLAHHEADAAERIAQAIDQAWAQVKDATGTDDFTAYREGYLDGLEHAEGIARTTLRQPHDPEAHT